MSTNVTRSFMIVLAFACLTVCLTANRVPAEEAFSSKTIDIGMVVRDIDKSVKFYTEALGMKEVAGFSVPAEFASKVGLTDGKKLDIRVLTLGDGPSATKLKLMQIPEVESKKFRNRFIHTTLGVSYITLHVTDTKAAVAKLKAHKIKTLKESPLPLPEPLPSSVFLTMVRDPDGNFVELVGPNKQAVQ